MSDVTGAKEDLLASVDLVPSLTQSWVKLASVYMEQGDPAKTFDCFEEAIKHNPKDPDIFYHRGQGASTKNMSGGPNACCISAQCSLCRDVLRDLAELARHLRVRLHELDLRRRRLHVYPTSAPSTAIHIERTGRGKTLTYW